MTNPAALDRAVREVTTPDDRIVLVLTIGFCGYVWKEDIDEIRARYREIVERRK